MGMIRCKKHGLSGLVFVCEHIESGCHSGEMEQVYLSIESLGALVAICKSCFTRFGDKLNDDDLRAIGGPGGLCEYCLDSWHKSTGQGDLQLRIDEKLGSSV
jgi:hypothetical protein